MKKPIQINYLLDEMRFRRDLRGSMVAQGRRCGLFFLTEPARGGADAHVR